MIYDHSEKQSWREFQRKLKRTRKSRRQLPRGISFLMVLCLALVVYYGITGKNPLGNCSIHLSKNTLFPLPQAVSPKVQEEIKSKNLSRLDIRSILKNHPLINARENRFTVHSSQGPVTVDIGLDMDLQRYLLDELDHLKTLTRGKPQYIAMVGLDPETGRIAAFTGFDLSDPHANPCISANFPAASIFKIITASAAVEKLNYTPRTPVYFNGGKYTLYKRQIKETRNKYTSRVSLAHAFAESINPVFGKIGSLKLGGEILKIYAAAFGFDKEFDSDFHFSPSTMVISDNAYQWAEVGCGFNKTTRISPLFSAMISGTILNNGKIPTPWLVEHALNAQGDTVYKTQSQQNIQAVKPETAQTVMKLMNKTITTGTASSSFKRINKDTVLSHLNLGGKTGSLYNNDHTVKFDWFTGFAEDRQSGKKLAVSVLVGHRKYIGKRASRFARMIFKEYFKNHVALN